jgi:hypothetical protein
LSWEGKGSGDWSIPEQGIESTKTNRTNEITARIISSIHNNSVHRMEKEAKNEVAC